jgi:O-antigen ligase
MLFISVLFLAARIAFITGAIFLFLLIIDSKFTWQRKLILTFSAFAFLVIACIMVPSLKNRFSEIVSWKTDQTSNADSFSQRTIILDCSMKVFSENLLWGTGSRNSQQQLNNCYCSKGWTAGGEQRFNSHNQYLSIGIKYGLVMLLVFILCLLIIFRKIFVLPEGKYFGFAIILFFLSESILERQMGVYFFGLISLLLYNICYSKNFAES